jgi:hypothetical protein
MAAAEPLPFPDDASPDDGAGLPGDPERRGDGGATPERVASQRSPLAILLALLLAAETLVAILLAMAKVYADVELTQGFADVPTHYDLAPALISDVVFLAAAVILGIATTAVWQYGWGRGSLVGPRKRTVVWSALFLQAMLLIPFETLLPQAVRPESSATSNLPPLAFVVVLGSGLAWVLRRGAFRGTTRRTLAFAACGVVVMVLVATASVGYAERTTAAAFVQAMGGVFAKPVPPAAVVCRHTISPDCAQAAANRTHHAFAWVPLPSNSRLVVAAMSRQAPFFYAFEESYFASALTTFDLRSGTDAGEPIGPVVRTFVSGGTTVRILEDSGLPSGGFIQFLWTVGGHGFEMDATRVGPRFSHENIDSLVALWRQVRYAEPAHAATSGRSGSSATAGA